MSRECIKSSCIICQDKRSGCSPGIDPGYFFKELLNNHKGIIEIDICNSAAGEFKPVAGRII